jgi:hypothetical protein
MAGRKTRTVKGRVAPSVLGAEDKACGFGVMLLLDLFAKLLNFFK